MIKSLIYIFLKKKYHVSNAMWYVSLCDNVTSNMWRDMPCYQTINC